MHMYSSQLRDLVLTTRPSKKQSWRQILRNARAHDSNTETKKLKDLWYPKENQPRQRAKLHKFHGSDTRDKFIIPDIQRVLVLSSHRLPRDRSSEIVSSWSFIDALESRDRCFYVIGNHLTHRFLLSIKLFDKLDWK